jgi:hypothetical protein
LRTSDMIKSKFWRARDLEGQPPVFLTIADVTEELLGRGGRQDVKCFLWFKEHNKGLQLNKSRVVVLEAAYGPDSELWVGKRVRLSFDPSVEFGGRAVGGVRVQTPPGIVYTPGTTAYPGWGDAPAQVPGRPPQPIWDDKRQQWITPQPAPAPAPANRPPPPVWNEATKSWETVNPTTGEIAAPAYQRPPTISERVNAGHPPAQDFGPLPPQEDFNDDIPF